MQIDLTLSQTLLENLGVEIGFYSVDGRIIFLNKAARAELNLSLDKISGGRIGEVFGHDWEALLLGRFSDLVASREVGMYSDTAQLSVGPRDLLSTYTLITEADGAITGILIAARDVTELKETQRSLVESHRFLETCQQMGKLTTFRINLESGVWAASDDVCHMLGCTPDQHYRLEDFESQLLPEDRDQWTSELKEVMRSGGTAEFDCRLKHLRTDAILSVRIGVWRGDSGAEQPNIISGVIRNISEFRAVEHQLIELAEKLRLEGEELSRKNIALTEFLSTINGEREKYRHEICESIRSRFTPFAARLLAAEKLTPAMQRELDGIFVLLNSGLAQSFTKLQSRLTPREFLICGFIKDGLSSKEIADALNVTVQTVEKHRYNLRRKLQLNKSDLNLATYLRQSL